MMNKKCRCIALILVIVMGIAGCKTDEKPYPFGKYTRQEALNLFHQNYGLFDELLTAILEDSWFLKNGDVHPRDNRVWVMPGNERDMELFNERSQLAIRKLLEFKPYMIAYDFNGYHSSEVAIIEITFIGDLVEYENFMFEYIVDQSDQKAKQELLKSREGLNDYVEQLDGGWIFSADLV